jgi:hypothetical protein
MCDPHGVEQQERRSKMIVMDTRERKALYEERSAIFAKTKLRARGQDEPKNRS